MAYTITKYDTRSFTSPKAADGPTFYRTYQNVRSGQRVDGWRDKVKAGVPAGSPFNVDWQSVVDSQSGSISLSYYTTNIGLSTLRTDKYSGVLPSTLRTTTLPHLSTNLTSLDNAALADLYSRIRSEKSHLNGLTVLGELRETIQSIRHPFSSVTSALSNYNKSLISMRSKYGDSARGRKALVDAASGLWLETAFSIRPGLNDTKSIAEAVARFEFPPPARDRIFSFSEAQFSSVSPGTPGSQSGLGYAIIYNRVTRQTSLSVRYTVGISAKPIADYSAARRLADVLGFTAENFIPTLYELTPWSFLVDYVSNVGSIVEAGATDLSSVTWVNKTTRIVTEELSEQLNSDPKDYLSAFGYTCLAWSGPQTHLGRCKIRRTTLARSQPTLSIPTLEFHLPVSGMKIANVLALFAAQKKQLTFKG